VLIKYLCALVGVLLKYLCALVGVLIKRLYEMHGATIKKIHKNFEYIYSTYALRVSANITAVVWEGTERRKDT
jgi:hypothetical protein